MFHRRSTTSQPLWHTVVTATLFTLCMLSVLWGLDGQWVALTGSHLHESAAWLGSQMFYWIQRPQGLVMATLLAFVAFTDWFLSSPRQRIASMRLALHNMAMAIAKNPGEYLKRSSLYR